MNKISHCSRDSIRLAAPPLRKGFRTKMIRHNGDGVILLRTQGKSACLWSPLLLNFCSRAKKWQNTNSLGPGCLVSYLWDKSYRSRRDFSLSCSLEMVSRHLVSSWRRSTTSERRASTSSSLLLDLGACPFCNDLCELPKPFSVRRNVTVEILGARVKIKDHEDIVANKDGLS